MMVTQWGHTYTLSSDVLVVGNPCGKVWLMATPLCIPVKQRAFFPVQSLECE